MLFLKIPIIIIVVGDIMYTILNNCNNKLVVKNSIFISLIYRINNIDEVESILKEVKNNYKDATHYCYAYIIDNNYKVFDDKEPAGTAGLPILQVLKNNNLNYVLAIVVRYFGGIKLGSSGLVRAYTKSITKVLDKNNIVPLVDGYNLIIEFNYNLIKDLDYLLNDSIINNKEFNNMIRYDIDIDNNTYNKLILVSDINIIEKTSKKIIKISN